MIEATSVLDTGADVQASMQANAPTRGAIQPKRDISFETLYTTHSAIANLPSELLALIFHIHLLDWRAQRTDDAPVYWNFKPLSVPEPHWTSFLLVCKHWHHTALGSPTLWPFVDPTHPARVRLSIKHAGKLPLELLSALPGVSDDLTIASLQLALPHIHRMHTLSLHLRPTLAMSLQSPKWAGLQAPLLERVDRRVGIVGICSYCGGSSL